MRVLKWIYGWMTAIDMLIVWVGLNLAALPAIPVIMIASGFMHCGKGISRGINRWLGLLYRADRWNRSRYGKTSADVLRGEEVAGSGTCDRGDSR